MKIRAVHVRRFRSLSQVSLAACGQLNVLIGKNNAGKSNFLTTIDLALMHLKRGVLAGPWQAPRPQEEFTDRIRTQPAQIGIEFSLPAAANHELRERIRKESPHLDKSVEQIDGAHTVSFIITLAMDNERAFMFTERIGIGTIDASRETLAIEGLSLLKLDLSVGKELFRTFDGAQGLEAEAVALRELLAQPQLRFAFEGSEEPSGRRFYVLDQLARQQLQSRNLRQQVEQLLHSAPDLESFKASSNEILTDIQTRLSASQKQETDGPIVAFAGEVRTVPAYAVWLMQQYGAISALHLRENKRPIGRPEADALLKLKVKRGGPARLDSIQQTVQALLGVNVDAFEAEGATRGESSPAEMDIDDFLVDANGAGIREALRLILDLELQTPTLAMIEEPEVHLHPGLERAIETYLREKSSSIQMFVTTHSTHFIDSASFQNVYLVSRAADRKTTIEAVGADDGAFKIPAELGLRLSSLFMFEQLLFVEGPSDEAVLRELARTLSVDLARANVGFVQMSGIKSFAHFAAEQTLDLLSRRQMRLWFLVDRDESADGEVKAMLGRLGTRASLKVLERRELENYLLVPSAVCAFVREKRLAAGLSGDKVTEAAIAVAIREESENLKDEVLRLRIERKVLRPVYLQNRSAPEGSIETRIGLAIEDLQARLENLEQARGAILAELDSGWPASATAVAPGCLVLEAVAKRFGVAFRKEIGDGAKVARYVPEDSVPLEIAEVIHQIGRAGRGA